MYLTRGGGTYRSLQNLVAQSLRQSARTNVSRSGPTYTKMLVSFWSYKTGGQ